MAGKTVYRIQHLGGTPVKRRHFLAGAAAGTAAAAVPLKYAAAADKLKVGILLPRSGIQAQIGIDCQRGADVAPEVLRAAGFPEMEYMLGDTETNVQIARAQAEKLINDGANLIVGCFDSGATFAAAQVCEQKGIPLVINIAAANKITEQGYKTVFRNFPTGPMIVKDAFLNQKELFKISGATPKTVALLHVNDTFGTGLSNALVALTPKFKMPFKIVEKISYDPAARDLSAEVRRVKSSKAEALWVVSRLNDAILLTRELVKQRWEGMGILSTGPGWYEKQYLQATGKYGNDVINLVPWYDPNKQMTKALTAAFTKKFPDYNLNTNHSHTFEALLIAADAFKRAGSTDATKLIEALKATDIKNNVTVGPGIHFNEKGQNPDTKNSGVQNRDGKNLSVLPVAAAVTKPVWPMTPFRKR